jgi:hypothetical protein
VCFGSFPLAFRNARFGIEICIVFHKSSLIVINVIQHLHTFVSPGQSFLPQGSAADYRRLMHATLYTTTVLDVCMGVLSHTHTTLTQTHVPSYTTTNVKRNADCAAVFRSAETCFRSVVHQTVLVLPTPTANRRSFVFCPILPHARIHVSVRTTLSLPFLRGAVCFGSLRDGLWVSPRMNRWMVPCLVCRRLARLPAPYVPRQADRPRLGTCVGKTRIGTLPVVVVARTVE